MQILTLIAPGTALAQQPADDVLLRLERGLNCAQRARQANAYLRLGEPKAVEEILDRTSSQPRRFALSNQHACHIVRMLYVPKPGQTLRGPRLGALMLPYESMPAESWPEFPYAVQGDVWFLLGENYQLAGVPETAKSYLEYCRANGTFRRQMFKVPTSKEAQTALKNLQASVRWRKIEWSYSSPEKVYSISPQPLLEFLSKQATF